MRTLFLGAGGRLGRILRPRWPGNAVWATRTDIDLNTPGALRTAIQSADRIFCLAGVTSGPDDAMDANVTLARQTLDAAASADGAHVFLFSSAAVYGALPGPNTEAGPTAPRSAYGHAKLRMEEMAAHHPTPCTCLRLGNVAGADAILGNWRPGFSLDTLADGSTPSRSYIGPSCLARTLSILALREDVPDTLNIAAPGAVAMGDLLDAAGLAWTARPATAQTIARAVMDTSALDRLVTFAPADSTAAGIVDDWRQKAPA